MICAIHQPNFIPYLGFFHKMKNSDIFIYYDSVQYSKNDFHNRNRIKTPNGPLWLTIPVKLEFGQKINEVRIANNDFKKKHLKTILVNYKNSRNFDYAYTELEKIYDNDCDFLLDFNLLFLNFFSNLLFPQKKIYFLKRIKFG